jgi:hypothetical protein
MTDAERSRFDKLEASGFKLDRYGSIIHHLYNRMGGHYIDVGTSAKIANGLIKIQTSTPVSYTENGILFDDGTELEADVIVFATGFEGDFWGLDEEGEIKGAWKANRKFFTPDLLGEGTENREANENRSSNVVSWWYPWSSEVLFSLHCAANQGEDFGNTTGCI